MSEEERPRRIRRRRLGRGLLRVFLVLLGPLVVLAVGGYYYATWGRVVETDNAYVKSDHILISADVSGRVVEVRARENAMVQAGDILFRIDPEPFRLALERAEAEIGAVAFEIESYRAAYREALAELEGEQQNTEFYGKEYQRRRQLAARGVISASALDDAQREIRISRKRLGAIREQVAIASSRLGGNRALPTREHPLYLKARAVRDREALDLERTVVRAPAAGVVSRMNLQAGEYIEAGTPVFSLTATDPIWIVANLKETSLSHVRVGQPAEVRVDAYPGRVWSARISSVSPATGSEFSLLPPQNATGNWVKVVQRLPVRLDIEVPPDSPVLRAGMSVTVDIDTGYERPLPALVQSALAWVAGRP